jgi:hypothetical protein
LIAFGSIAQLETLPQRSIAGNTLPLSIFAASNQAFSASTGRSVRETISSLSVLMVLVRPRCVYLGGHSIISIGLASTRIPKMMGEIVGQKPQRILAHALVDQMPERFDALADQEFPTLQL